MIIEFIDVIIISMNLFYVLINILFQVVVREPGSSPVNELSTQHGGSQEVGVGWIKSYEIGIGSNGLPQTKTPNIGRRKRRSQPMPTFWPGLL